MNIAILGATGNFGITLTSKLLAVSDHHLTLISTSAGSKFEDNYRITAKNVDATNIKTLKKVMVDNIISCEPKRLIFMTTVGVYNELENAAQLNVDNEPLQIPNQYSVNLIENSDMDYTIFRLGLLEHGDENDYIITKKGEKVKTHHTTAESVIKIALEIINNLELYSRESISITKK